METVKAVATKTVGAVQSGSWRFFGTLFMETKNGVQAVSLNRLLGLSTYVACMWIWLKTTTDVPRDMLITMWILLGINGAAKIIGLLPSKKA